MAYQSGYGDVSYDSNGYLNFLPTPDYGTNPWSSFVQSQQGNVNSAQGAAAGIPGMQNQIQSQMQAYQKMIDANAYPSFPNAGGLGTQTGYGSAPMQNTNQQSQSEGPAPRGLNPWSLQGEALSRY